jgi:glycyl-tRNA synthetase beta chain
MMTDFLLELRSEEIPARMQAKAKEDLARLFADALGMRGYEVATIESFATPRRLALVARGLPNVAPTITVEIKGPKVDAPQQAIEGFLRKYDVAISDLVERSGVYFLDRVVPGESTSDVLSSVVPRLILDFPWPKSQRWGAASISTESLRWVRPLQGIVALLGDEVVPCEVDGIVSGRTTMGHRFHSSGPVEIANAGAYVETLRVAHVIVHFSERCAIIRDGARAAASAAGLTLVEDEGLVAENAGLTEWPVPMLGRFDPAYLAVPQEVIQLTARVNQKYFVCHDSAGKLANAFVCTANIVANDGGVAIVAGNEKVLAARLSDAKFFWEQDLKVALDDQAKKLDRITFHEKLGTVADKVERVAKLARWLVEEGIVKGDPNQAERAARLAKADLVTGMVGEFPELQGIMGGYYARAQGEPDAVADAVRDHYKPVGQGDDVPTAPVTVAVSLADKLDTFHSFFGADMQPTGSKDPFALRRAGLGIIALMTTSNVRYPIVDAHGQWDFIVDRLKVQQREAGISHDLIEAVVGAGAENLVVRLLARVKALQAFMESADGANLLAGYKRAANILKQSDADGAAPLQGPSPEEAALLAALDTAEPAARAAVGAEDFTAAMTALASLRAPIDAFFDGVMVNDPDPAIRAFRLSLLSRFRDACHAVADFSKIEG